MNEPQTFDLKKATNAIQQWLAAVFFGFLFLLPPNVSASPAHKSFKCLRCHSGAEPTPAQPMLLKSYDPFCKDCHRSHSLTHSNDIKTPSLVNKDFPTFDGKISCVTCHEESSCRGKGDLGKMNLRGGPYSGVEQFCQRCHSQKTNTASGLPLTSPVGSEALTRNHVQHPHCRDLTQAMEPAINTKNIDAKAIDVASERKVKSPKNPPVSKPMLAQKCQICHEATTTIDAITWQQPLLKLSADKLCLNCHKTDLHPLSVNHLGRKPALLRPEISLQELQSQHIQLDASGGMTCSSCHLAHESCDTSTASVLADHTKADARKSMLKGSSGQINDLCGLCHKFK